MKNSEIHNELDDKEIRNFLAKELYKSRIIGCVGVKYIEVEIERLQKNLEAAKRYEGIVSLIEKMNWKEFDIGDYVHYDSETYFPFLGTQEEYERLKDKINIEKDKREE